MIHWIVVLMSRVRIDSASGFVLQRQQQLLCSRCRDDVAGRQRTICRDHDRKPIPIFDLHRPPVKVVAVLLKDVGLDAVLHHGFDRKHDPLRPFFDRHEQVGPLPRLEPPVDEAMTVHLGVAHFLVRQTQIEVQRP